MPERSANLKNTQELRDFARLQNQGSEGFILSEAEAGTVEMSKIYVETGREL